MRNNNSLEEAARQLGVHTKKEIHQGKRNDDFSKNALNALLQGNKVENRKAITREVSNELLGMSHEIELSKLGLSNNKIHNLSSARLKNWLKHQPNISRGLRTHISGIIRLKSSNEFINRRFVKIHDEVKKRNGISDSIYAMVMAEHSIPAGRAVGAYEKGINEVLPNKHSLEKELLAVRQGRYPLIKRFSSRSNSNIANYTNHLARSGVKYDCGRDGLPGGAVKRGTYWEIGKVHNGGGNNIGIIPGSTSLPPIACASFISLLLYKMGKLNRGSRSVAELMRKLGGRNEYINKNQLSGMKVGDVISTITTGRADDKGYRGRHVGIVASVDSRGRPLRISHMTDSGGAKPQTSHYNRFMTTHMKIWKIKRFS